MATRCGNILVGMCSSSVLTSRNAYIRCKGDELYSNPASWQGGTCVRFESHFSDGRCAAGTSHLGGLCVSASQVIHRTCLVTPANSL
jgi:hypothetical protein